MTVYVDDARSPFGRMLMCHMVADTLAELHDMADKIGLSRRWVQLDGSFPHYDVSAGYRVRAVKAGAQQISRRDLSAFMKRRRADPAFVAEWRAAREAST